MKQSLCLFNDAISSSNYTASIGRTNETVEKMRKAAIVVSFQVIFTYLQVGTSENVKTFDQIAGLWTETDTRSAIQWTAMFGQATDDATSSVQSSYVPSRPSIVLQLACHGTNEHIFSPTPPSAFPRTTT